MLPAADRYDHLLARFRWDLPARYNIGVDVCDKWADGSGRLALIHETAQGDVSRLTFDDLRNASNRLANSFARAGLRRGDRIGIFLAQGPETAIAHLAAYKFGAIAVPLFTLFGVDALEYRLANSEAAALVTDAAGYAKIAPLRAQLPALHTAYCIGGDAPDVPGVLRYDAALAAEAPDFVPVDTAADDPAVIIYTSGTTGKPKG
ncbi:AMP-binding protein, partial [Burkholderia cenocepacia]